MVDRLQNVPGTPTVDLNSARADVEWGLMDQPPYRLDAVRREAVLGSIQEVCGYRRWRLAACHVRSNHVHLVVEAEDSPELVMRDCKAYSSRRLNRMGVDGVGRKRWARHGSTRWLWRPENVSAAVRYVVDGQGEAMAVFEAGGE